MPVGVLLDVLSVIAGGAAGALVKDRLSAECKDRLNLVFGVCSMAIGIQSIFLMENMPAVMFAVILGTAAGLAVRLEARVSRTAARGQRWFSRLRPAGAAVEKDGPLLVTAAVLFCASGTGIYGALVSGMTGDHSVLIAKAILDLFTALIFACSLGGAVSLIALPQLVILLALYFCARLIYPLTTPAMVNDFKACGGIIMLATGFRVAGIKEFPIADMLPAMVLVMPLSRLWTLCVLPLVG